MGARCTTGLWGAAVASCLVSILALPGGVRAHADLHERIQAIDAEIRQRPGDAALVLKRAELHRLHEDWPSAEADYERAARLDPALAAVDLGRGRLYLESGRPEAARAPLDRFLEKHPAHADALLVRARTLVALGQHLPAAEDYTRAIAVMAEPTPELYLERAQALAAAGPRHRLAALSGLDEGLARLGLVVTLQQTAVEMERAEGRTEQALARVDTLIAAFTRPERWIELRGEVLLQAGRTDEARAEFARALRSLESLPAGRRSSRAVLEMETRLRARLR